MYETNNSLHVEMALANQDRYLVSLTSLFKKEAGSRDYQSEVGWLVMPFIN